MKSIRSVLKNFIFSELKNNQYFYGKYQGGRGLSIIKKMLIILLDLRSLKDFIFYHNAPLIVNSFGRAHKIQQSNELNGKEKEILHTLRKDGIVFLDGYFQDLVDKFSQNNILENDSDDSYILNNNIQLNEECFKILNDKSLLRIASQYYGVKSFYRYRPTASLTYPKRSDINSTQRFHDPSLEYGDFSDEWHVDSVYNLQYHILLKDTSKEQTRMLFAKNSKVGFFDRFAGFASEEYVRENFTITDLCGSKGTVILFDGSKNWHRLYPVKGVKRQTSSVLFTRGQQPCDPDMYLERVPFKEIDQDLKEAYKYIL